MTLDEWLEGLENKLKADGFLLAPQTVAVKVARTYASDTFPVAMFRAWVARCPEAQQFFRDSPLNPVVAESPREYVRGASLPAQPFELPADAPPEARKILGDRATRVVTPFDMKRQVDEDLAAAGKDDVLIGMTGPIKMEDGNTVIKVKMGPNEPVRTGEIIDVAGPVFLVRSTVRNDEAWDCCVLHVHPDMRAKVWDAVRQHPRFSEDVNFSPFDMLVDPWLSADKAGPEQSEVAF